MPKNYCYSGKMRSWDCVGLGFFVCCFVVLGIGSCYAVWDVPQLAILMFQRPEF